MFTRQLLQKNLKTKPTGNISPQQTSLFSKLKKLVCFNSKHIGKIYGLDPVTTISQVDTILNEESNVGENLYLVNHVKSQIQSSSIGDFQTLTHSYQQLREQYLKPNLTADNIAHLNSEELFAAVNNLYVGDDPLIGAAILNRLFELIQEDVGSESSTIDEEGRITVDMRILEPHLFAKIMGCISMNNDLFLACENIQDLAQYAMVYIKRQSLNFSFDDKSLALISILNFANPTPGKPPPLTPFLTKLQNT